MTVQLPSLLPAASINRGVARFENGAEDAGNIGEIFQPIVGMDWRSRLHNLASLPPFLARKLWDAKRLQSVIVVSTLLHGVLFLIPTPKSSPTVNPAESAKTQVRVVQVPKKSQVSRRKANPSRPAARAKARRSRPKARPRPAAARQSPIRKPTPKPTPKPKAAPPAAKSPDKTSGKRSERNSPDPGRSGDADDKPTPRPTPSPTDDPGSSSWDDFPQFPGAKPGCFELDACHETTAVVAAVAEFFKTALAEKKYKAQAIESAGDRTVYQISRGGLNQYLSILDNEGKTVYVLGEQPLNLSDLAGAVQVTPEVASVLSDIGGKEADPSFFAEPNLFYESTPKGQKKRPGITNITLVPNTDATVAIDQFFKPNLVLKGFDINDLARDYGGGALYEVKKDEQVFYLNLVPTQDKTGMLVVTWKKLPD